jgi:pseudouridine synthase
MQFFDKMKERLYPVGRLDYMSEGLLLVTNDGELANRLTKASSGVEKTYLVKVAGQPTEAELDILRGGVAIERGKPGSPQVRTSPARIRQVRQGDNPWYEVVLIEGRNRELRKMFEEVGHFVEKIRRTGYGPLVLDQEPGNLRELEPEELERCARPPKASCAPPNPRTSAAATCWMQACCPRSSPSPAAVRVRPGRWKRLLPRQTAQPFAPRNSAPAPAETGQAGQTEQAALRTPSPAAQPTNSSARLVHPVKTGPSPPNPPGRSRTVLRIQPVKDSAPPLAAALTGQMRVPPRAHQPARHGRKTPAPPIRQRALPLPQPLKIVPPPPAPSPRNPPGRSRNAQPQIDQVQTAQAQTVQPAQNSQTAQSALPARSTNAPPRPAAQLPPAKPEFLTRILARSVRPTFTSRRSQPQIVRARSAPAHRVQALLDPVTAVPARPGQPQTAPVSPVPHAGKTA